MGQQIIRQPDGRYALWSSIVDSFVLIDAMPDEIADAMIEREAENIRRQVARIVAELAEGRKPYLQFTKTWYEALRTHQEVHGEPFDLERVRAGEP